MPSMVTAIIAAGRNRIIDCNAGEACDVVIKVFTCIKIAWDRVRNMSAAVLTTITTMWGPGLRLLFVQRSYPEIFFKLTYCSQIQSLKKFHR